MFLLLPFFVSTLSVSATTACVEPLGIGTTYQLTELTLQDSLANFGENSIVRQFTIATADTTEVLETPIAVRYAAYDYITFFNILGLYETSALDFWGRYDLTNSRRFCEAANSTEADERDAHRLLSLVYGILHVIEDRYSDEALIRWKNYMNDTIGVDPDLCDVEDCVSSTATPWALGKIIADEVFQFELADGWNRNGDYDRQRNNIPYSDFRAANTRYVPVNDPWEVTDINRWQPLLEDDGLGFLFRQEHVTPHIGFTAKSLFFQDDEICSKTVPPPDYNYPQEIQLVFERMANLTEEKKVEIELFDDKFRLNILTGVFEIFRGNGLNSWEYIVSSLIELVSLYESIILVWKEKVVYDKIRPTSIVHELLGDTLITTYAGTTLDGATFGTQTFPASDFQTYERSMPHSEYPSASACMCASFAEAKIEEFGSDIVIPPVFFPPQFPFSSTREPLSTPSKVVFFSYSQWSEISERCSQTRLEGGMHFTAAVPAGEQLCEGIGSRVAQSVKSLVDGIKPSYVVPYDTDENSYVERMQCYRDPYETVLESSLQPTEEPTQYPV